MLPMTYYEITGLNIAMANLFIKIGEDSLFNRRVFGRKQTVSLILYEFLMDSKTFFTASTMLLEEAKPSKKLL